VLDAQQWGLGHSDATRRHTPMPRRKVALIEGNFPHLGAQRKKNRDVREGRGEKNPKARGATSRTRERPPIIGSKFFTSAPYPRLQSNRPPETSEVKHKKVCRRGEASWAEERRKERSPTREIKVGAAGIHLRLKVSHEGIGVGGIHYSLTVVRYLPLAGKLPL